MYSPGNHTDDEKLLLSKISAGDELAFRLLFDRYRPQVYTYALKIIKTEVLAEEILHDVFLKIWLHKNLPEVENINYYLKTITRNLTLNVLRRQNLDVLTSLHATSNWQEGHEDTEDQILLNDSNQILNQAIELLTPQQKLVYKLCKQDGLKYAQVAEQLSISPLTVKTHMQQILRILRTYLKLHGSLVIYLVLLWFLR
ncbi:MAG: RNA polymerase sigma-70 factor [Sphingobacteriaceae bacterium]|nr:MAG: RNA polymerase sigma-70 factor [Sphingobacteriaceae bacterium]